jgi:hypothetical protein
LETGWILAAAGTDEATRMWVTPGKWGDGHGQLVAICAGQEVSQTKSQGVVEEVTASGEGGGKSSHRWCLVYLPVVSERNRR